MDQIPLGTEVGRGPGDIVLDEDQLHLPKERDTAAPTFHRMSMAKRLDGSGYHLARR